jgi:DNA repair photolyase
MVRYEFRASKTILNKLKYIDGWFWCRYTLNPYNGCEHACVYCDARSDRYYLHQDFENTIYVKQNAPILLETKLKNCRSMQSDVVAIGGTCDAYQPAESEFKITRSILEILLKYQFPVSLSTKNNLILRDMDILQDIADVSWANVAFTITSLNQEIVDFLEPRATPSLQRLEAIRKIKENYPKIQIGVNLMPIIPMLEDNQEDLEQLINAIKDYGGDFVLFSPGMTLRDNQKRFFLEALKKYFQDHGKASDFHTFQQNYAFSQFDSNPKLFTYFSKISTVILNACKKQGLPTRARRWIPNDYRKVNYQAAEILLSEAYLKMMRGENYQNEQWAGLKIQNLEEPISILDQRGLLGTKIKELTPPLKQTISHLLNKPIGLQKYFSK